MIVVDASVAIKWIIVEEHTEQAQALYDATIHADDVIIAPPLLPSEVSNSLRQRMRGTPPLPRAHALAFWTTSCPLPSRSASQTTCIVKR